MPALPYRGRFAPSPTGPLHFGSLLAAFGSWLLARHAGGQWCVRIEDIDPPRAEAGASARQLRTLAAFGLHSDLPVLYQSGRHAQYEAAIATLLEAGLAFECSCSRADLAGMGGIHHACVAPLGARRAVRLRVPPQPPVGFDDALQGHVEQDVHTEVGDVVLRRADGYWAYQLAVVVDDAAQAITDVVRGADLLDSTPRQLLLQRALGLPQPRYLHLPLIWIRPAASCPSRTLHLRWTTPIRNRPCTPPGLCWDSSRTPCRAGRRWTPCCSMRCSIFRHSSCPGTCIWTRTDAHHSPGVTRIAPQHRRRARQRACVLPAPSLTCPLESS